MSLTPNPMVMAGALCQVVRKAKIAVLGPTIPILNPIRVAEEFAMIDVMSNGRLIAGMMRGTGNEYVTYNINPSESRERFAEALHLIRRCWTEKEPFGWEGKYYHYRTISIWPRPVQTPHPPMFMSDVEPRSRRVRRPQSYRRRLRFHDGSAGEKGGHSLSRVRARGGLGADGRQRDLSRAISCCGHGRTSLRGDVDDTAAGQLDRSK